MKMKVRNKAAFTDEVTALEKENARVSYEAALEGIVLLENDGTLPLTPGKIALYGAGADMTIKGGTGSGEVHERHVISILEGLETSGFTVTTKDWIGRYAEEYRRSEEAYVKKFRKGLLKFDMVNIMASPFQYPAGPMITLKDIEQSETDTCIYVISRQAGEGSDRKLKEDEYSLSGVEKENIAFARVSAIGAVGSFTAGVFDTKTKQYRANEFEGNFEIVSLSGTVDRMNGAYYAHLHMSAGNEKGEVFGGHLNRAVVSATCEMTVTLIEGEIDRCFDEEVGLNLWKF